MICLNVPAINLGWNSYNNVKQKESSGSLNSQTISTQAKTEERNPHNSDIPLNNKPNADNITLGQRIVNNFMLVLKTIRVIRGGVSSYPTGQKKGVSKKGGAGQFYLAKNPDFSINAPKVSVLIDVTANTAKLFASLRQCVNFLNDNMERNVQIGTLKSNDMIDLPPFTPPCLALPPP